MGLLHQWAKGWDVGPKAGLGREEVVEEAQAEEM